MYDAKIIMRLEDEMRDIERSVFEHPSESYEKFRELVGFRNGLKKAILLIREISKEDDEL